MFVVATAGHVDHGKSTLVKRLTGQEPDRWEEEKRRGLTIDLGFVWTTTPAGRDVAFVDVPGHEKFLGNMLAGVGPVPAVMFVVAADEGWQEQSSDHRDAIDAFGISHAVVAMTRADRADAQRRADTRAQIAAELAGTTLADAPVVEVSARTSEGIEDLLDALDAMLAELAAPDPDARVRLWLDRSFSITGAGTVVTGTLTDGRIAVGDELDLAGRRVTVRGVQSEERALSEATGTARVAVNLRDVAADEVGRGDVLTTPGAWHVTSSVDARRLTGEPFTRAPREVALHLGTAVVTAGVRPLGDTHVRLTFDRALPVAVGDRLVLRRPGSRHVYAGVAVLDVDPPELSRRGASAARAEALAQYPLTGDVAAEVRRRGAIRRSELVRFGLNPPADPPKGVVAFGEFWVQAKQVLRWRDILTDALTRHLAANPLSAGLSRGAALGALNLPDPALLPLAVAAAKLTHRDGIIARPEATVDLGAAEAGVAELERRLRADPFAAPEADDLARLGLGTKQLAAAERAGRLLRIADGVVLLPDAVERARTILSGLDQPFTASVARRALGTTRRVAIPLLELLDARGVTRRGADNTRVVR
ncbi:selenocysteine-specific translation elongation factor [Corynebacterium uterequi]|uniref:Selenocysteine-specific elongation factor SelB n=1 Tax=Corynebacterium uterequi TaxID=1072256 RepID=A0A0G3HF39_9CORY|nr:selenocysteine-specific translation elongation factor [Corynebacterium uterequi]AKK10578.1 selenocysteine-specific elongation factor SelB [Corynebacterium uterequi]